MKMRFFIIVLGMIVHSKAIGQNSLFSSPYFHCLRINILSSPTSFASDTLFIKKSPFLEDQDGFIEGKFIRILDEDELFRRTTKGATIQLIVIHPVEYNKEIGFITISEFGVTRRRRKYSFINNGFGKFEMRYDCDLKKYDYHITNSH